MKEDEANRVAGELLSDSEIFNCSDGTPLREWQPDDALNFAREAIAAALVKLTQGQEPPEAWFEQHFRDRIDVYADRHPTLLVRQLACLLRTEWTTHPAPRQQEERKPLTDEQCDEIAAKTMDKVAAACDMHALDINPNITSHHTLRRALIGAGYEAAREAINAALSKEQGK